jgi:hypothetical protein
MAWLFSVNNTPANGWQAMFILKTLLKAAGWLIPSSSDGSTYSASSDIITSGGGGAGGLANLKAWIRFKHPTAVGREFTVLVGSASDDTSWRIIANTGGTGFTAGAPSATVPPSGSGGTHSLVGGGTDAAPTFNTLFDPAGTFRFSCAAGDASTGYAFCSFGFPIGGGASVHGWMFERYLAASYNPLDLDPFVTGCGHVNFWESSFLGGTIYASNGNDSVLHAISAVSPPFGLTTDPYTSKDQGFPMIDYVTGVNLKGSRQNFFRNTVSESSPTVLVNLTPGDTIDIGHAILPWNGSPVIV